VVPEVRLGGRYQLEDRIAAGGTGEVWRGLDTVLGRPVAVKLLREEYAEDPEAIARLRGEARHAGLLSHPAIAWIQDYHDACQPEPAYLVMELVDGPSLEAVLAAGPLDPVRALDVIAQVADGLHAAHQAGLVHRDVKPANLMLDRLGNVKITDFGIARRAGSASAGGALVTGTPAYLAPERACGAPATPASDLYALGIVGYECLSGHPPYSGTPPALATAHRDAPLPPLPDTVPAEAARLIGELTVKDPAARPASARDVSMRAARMRDALSGGAGIPVPSAVLHADAPTLRDIPVQGQPSGRWPGLPGIPARRRWLAVVPATAAVLLAVLLTMLAARIVAAATAAPGSTARTAPPRDEGTPGFVNVQRSSVIGLQVTTVDRQLRQLGLVVRLRWQPTSLEPPGTVVSVQPGGRVPAGGMVVVTGALQPQPADENQGQDGGGYYGSGGHDGGGHDGGSGN
jgi:protein kinase-like protein